MLMTLKVVVASQVCAHVQIPKIMYIKYVQVLYINYTSQAV